MKKMSIEAYKDETFSSKVGSYEVMINPESIKLDRSIGYSTVQVPNRSQESSKYEKTPGSTLSFDLTIDCTGVVDIFRIDLPTEIKNLSNIVYNYQGDIHRPYFIQLSWGIGETFKCVLKTFNTNYTLFKPDGTPLRAKISLSFSSYLDPSTIAKLEDKQSPDLTHLINVVRGDSLPDLSQKTYNTSDYFVQLAEFNGLDKFRQLQPGTQLIFPPIVTHIGDQ